MNGLNYCHNQNIYHRDLKPENLFLNADYDLKIGDFGFGKLVERDEGGVCTTLLGTPQYMAPEQHQKKEYKGSEVDIFAAGVIMFISRAQHPPFAKAIAKDQFYKYIGGKRPDLFWKTMGKGKPDGYFSEEFQDLCGRMMELKDRRINMNDILSHPWMTSTDVPSNEEILKEFTVREQKAKAAL